MSSLSSSDKITVESRSSALGVACRLVVSLFPEDFTVALSRSFDDTFPEPGTVVKPSLTFYRGGRRSRHTRCSRTAPVQRARDFQVIIVISTNGDSVRIPELPVRSHTGLEIFTRQGSDAYGGGESRGKSVASTGGVALRLPNRERSFCLVLPALSSPAHGADRSLSPAHCSNFWV